MQTQKHVIGDIITLTIEGIFDVLIHGCNCFNTMGAGLALQIKKRLPEAYSADLITIKGDKNKLGNYSRANIVRGINHFTVINAYTQYNYGRKGVYINYDAMDNIFKNLGQTFRTLLTIKGTPELRIAYPKIGATLGGGDWDLIYNEIIIPRLSGCDHTLVTLPKKGII
jgi:O-acetyl-ADP-ribose deacetylase (regulator of RNase III)